MNTTENNKIIAEFMRFSPDKNGVYPIECINDGKGFHLETMKYHYDWNWLMEVVEKIESIDDDSYIVEISDYTCNIVGTNLNINKAGSSKKESAYNACIEFIKWYNEQK